MFAGLAAGVFVLLWIWVRRRQHAQAVEIERLAGELSGARRDVEQAHHRLQQQVGLLNALHDHKVSPTGEISWKDLADFTVKTASSLVEAETVILLRWDPKAAEYQGVAAHGLSPQQVAQLRFRSGEGVLGKAAQERKVLVVNESAAATRLPQEAALTTPYLVLPLWVHSQVQGLLIFCRMKDAAVGPESMRLAVLMAKHVELTMENLGLYENRERVYAELVSTLVLALGAKDPGSSGHSDHCRALIQAMAQELHLPRMLAEQIEFGALLHDVGKLGLSEALLTNKDPLTDDEYAVVKKHPQIGYDILQGVDFLKGVAPIVLYHHEWVNGQGYPEGLAGEEIPLGARMVGIVDAWDAMTTDQPYRPAMSKSNAVAELRQQAGTQFDPRLVDVFVHVIDRLERAEVKVAER